jgi:hypothetical protein
VDAKDLKTLIDWFFNRADFALDQLKKKRGKQKLREKNCYSTVYLTLLQGDGRSDWFY